MALTHDEFYAPMLEHYRGRYGDEAARLIVEDHAQGVLNKGLATTGTIAQDGTTGGDALKQQDLYRQIAVAELQSKEHAAVYNWIKKTPTYTDVVEKTSIDAWGGQRRGGFINPSSSDGGISARDPNIERGALPVKWMGGRYQIFRSALAIQSLRMSADPIIGGAEEVSSSATLQQLILNANEMIIYGDGTANPHEPDGILKQIRDANSGRFVTRINMNGQPLTPDSLPDIEENLRSKGGLWTDMFWSPKAFADMRKSMVNFIRTDTGNAVRLGTYTREALVMDLEGNPDVAKIHMDNFLDPMDATDGLVGPKPPKKPSGVVAAPDAAEAVNVWGSCLPAGTYNYKVRAVSADGWSEMVAAAAVAVPNGQQSVKITITNDSGNALRQVAYFDIFRGDGATGKVAYLGRVGATDVNPGSTVVFYDNGEFVPGTSVAFAVTNRQIGVAGRECMLRQLMTPTKVLLPPDVMAEQAAWIMAFTPQLLVPQFGLVIENIGRV